MNPFLSRMRGYTQSRPPGVPTALDAVVGCAPGGPETSSPGPSPSGEPTVVSSPGPGLGIPNFIWTSSFERPEDAADCPMLGCDEWFAHPGPRLQVVTV